MKRSVTSALLLMGCAVGTKNDQQFGAGNDAGSGSFGNGNDPQGGSPRGLATVRSCS
jgi:hypothetical protein